MYNELIISQENLINNVKQVKKYNPNTLLCAMVKANAYGVGLVNVINTIDSYVDYYGVACFFEAEMVRKFSNKKILILGNSEEINDDFSYACNDLEELNKLISLKKKINIHLKINTGMNRYGFKSFSELNTALRLIKKSKLNLEGVFTHFATDDECVDVQMKKFNKCKKLILKYGFNPIFHVDNSRVSIHNNHSLGMLRVGFNLYGEDDKNFSSVMTIKSKVVSIIKIKRGELVGYDRRFIAKKKMTVAVIPIGYADGFSISYIDMPLVVRGKRCRVLNICMDCFMLDVSGLDIKKGDDIIVLDHINSLSNYALHSNTSPYEVLVNFSHIRANLVLVPTES